MTIVPGELWLADLHVGTILSLASAEGYRSPVFLAGNQDVLVLRGTEVRQAEATQTSTLGNCGGARRFLKS